MIPSLLWIDAGAGLIGGGLVLLPRMLIAVQAIANAAWAAFCAIAAVVVAPHATYFGIAHLTLESLFVGGLAVLEWRNMESHLIRS